MALDRLSPRRTIAQVGAEEHADTASHTLLSKVDVSLLNSAFEVRVTQLPVNSRFVIADPRVERSVTGGRNC